MNKITLTGRLTRDPELRTVQDNKSVAVFTLAVSRRHGKNDNASTNTDFIPILAWQKLGEIAVSNLVKGSKVLVEGRLQTRRYEAKDGTKRVAFEVVASDIEFMDSKSKPKDDVPETEPVPMPETEPEEPALFDRFSDSVSVEDVPF